MGLVSYFKTQDKSLLPTVTKNEVETVPMSEYQFLQYSAIRKAEIESEKASKSKSKKPKKKSKKKDDEEEKLFEDKKSSYRAYSRMHCSFVFPETFPRPYPGDLEEPDLEHDSQEFELTEEDPLEIEIKEEMEGDKKLVMKQYEKAKSKILRALNKNKESLFTMNDPEQLMKYSPKYNIILNRINSLNGLAFIYTEYKTLEGIALLQIVLKANGYAPFLLKK